MFMTLEVQDILCIYTQYSPVFQSIFQQSFIKKCIVYCYLLFFMDELASRKGWEKNSSTNNTRRTWISRRKSSRAVIGT